MGAAVQSFAQWPGCLHLKQVFPAEREGEGEGKKGYIRPKKWKTKRIKGQGQVLLHEEESDGAGQSLDQWPGCLHLKHTLPFSWVPPPAAAADDDDAAGLTFFSLASSSAHWKNLHRGCSAQTKYILVIYIYI